MRLVFLGTAGGRFAVLNQLRATGGIVLELDDQVIHIDPGPGALVRAKEYGVKLDKLTAVVVSHCHPDHYADAELVIEAMTHGTTRSGGVLIGNEHVIKGGDDYRPVVSPYHLRALEKYYVMKPDEQVKIGEVSITATKTHHSEPACLGFVFSGSKTVGYASDTVYFSGQEGYFKDCDYLILNVLRPRGREWPKHMNTDQAAKLVGLAKPSVAVITHFGILMLKAGPRREAKYIEERTGVKTIAAHDGLVISDDDERRGKPGSGGLQKWIK